MCVCFEWITLSIWGSVSGSPEDAHGMAVTMDTNVAAATTRFRLDRSLVIRQVESHANNLQLRTQPVNTGIRLTIQMITETFSQK